MRTPEGRGNRCWDRHGLLEDCALEGLPVLDMDRDEHQGRARGQRWLLKAWYGCRHCGGFHGERVMAGAPSIGPRLVCRQTRDLSNPRDWDGSRAGQDWSH